MAERPISGTSVRQSDFSNFLALIILKYIISSSYSVIDYFIMLNVAFN